VLTSPSLHANRCNLPRRLSACSRRHFPHRSACLADRATLALVGLENRRWGHPSASSNFASHELILYFCLYCHLHSRYDSALFHKRKNCSAKTIGEFFRTEKFCKSGLLRRTCTFAWLENSPMPPVSPGLAISAVAVWLQICGNLSAPFHLFHRQ